MIARGIGVRTVAGQGYRSSVLINEIAKSYPFQYRKNLTQEIVPVNSNE